MRLDISFDSGGQKSPQPPNAKGPFRNLLFGLVAAVVILIALYVIAGSVIYPLYWFEFMFGRGLSRSNLAAYGFSYQLQEAPWLIWGLIIAVPVVCFVVWKWLPWVTDVFRRRALPIIAMSVVFLVVDALVLYQTQKFNYTVYSGLHKIVGAAVQLPQALAEMGLPPSAIAPPVDLIYVDSKRISELYSELQPDLIESERTRTAEKKADESIGLEAKPMTLKSEGLRDQTETQKLTHPDPSTSQRCLALFKNILSRKDPPYYNTFAMTSNFQFFTQIKQLLVSARDATASDSVFSDPAPGMHTAAAVINRLNEAREKTPPNEVERRVREQLTSLSGLVVVQGDFDRTSIQGGLAEFQEQFKKAPRQIFFRFPLRDKEALHLLPGRSTLLVLGDVIKKWDAGPYIDFQPIVIISGTPVR
jgi:hypothetical protein